MFDKLFDAFEKEGEELFFVGGFVRDLLAAQDDDFLRESALRHPDLTEKERKDIILNMPVPDAKGVFWNHVRCGTIDVDFATSARPEKTIEILKKHGFKTIPIGIEFGTIQTIYPNWGGRDIKMEITTYRCKESYKKGSRKPAVQFGKSLEEDLARRDFTFNAIAMDRNLNKIDPFEGHADLIQGLIYTPSDPEISFSDDPLRILRAYRFYARGVASLSSSVGNAIEELGYKIQDVSKERIFEEMTKILVAEHARVALRFMAKDGLFDYIAPELQTVIEFTTVGQSKNLWDHVTKVVDQCRPEPVLRWAALFHDIGKPKTVREENGNVSFHRHEELGAIIWENVAKDLKISNNFKESVKIVIQESGNFTALTDNQYVKVTDKAVRRFIRKVGRQNLGNIYKFAMADMTTSDERKRERMQAALTRLKNRMDRLIQEEDIDQIKLPKNTGTLLMKELNIEGGPVLGKVMKGLTQKLVDGELTLESDFIKEGQKILYEINRKESLY